MMMPPQGVSERLNRRCATQRQAEKGPTRLVVLLAQRDYWIV